MISVRPSKHLAANSSSIEVITEVLCAIHGDIDEDSTTAFNILIEILTGRYLAKHPRRGNWMRALVHLNEKEYADIPLIKELITDQRKVIAATEECQRQMVPDIKRCLKKAFENELHKVERYARQEIDLALAKHEAKIEEESFLRGASSIIHSEYLGDIAPQQVANVIALIQKDAKIDIIPAIFMLHKLMHNSYANLHACQGEWVATLSSLKNLEQIVNPVMENLLEQTSHISHRHHYESSADPFNRHAGNSESLECEALRLEYLNGNTSLIQYAVPAVLAAIALTAVLILRYSAPGKIVSNWAYQRLNFFNQDPHRDEANDVEQQALLRNVDTKKSGLNHSYF